MAQWPRPIRVLLLCVFVIVTSALGAGIVFAQSVCQGAECKATSEPVTAPPGDYVFEHDPRCGDGTEHSFQTIITVFAGAGTVGLSEYAGPVIQGAIGNFGQGLRDWVASQGGDIAKMLQPYTQPTASCVIVPVKLPKGARATGYRLFWRESGGQWEETPYGSESNVKGWAWKKFSMEPDTEETSHGSLVYTIFKNWSHDRTREARLDVYFSRPANWIPPKQNPW